MKNQIILFFTIVFLFSCEKEIKSNKTKDFNTTKSLFSTHKNFLNKQIDSKNIQKVFWGDSMLSSKNYLDNLLKSKEYLCKQNKLYEKKNLSFKTSDNSFLVKDIHLQLSKKVFENNYQITLYTLKKNIKIDSIQFYRKINRVRSNSDTYNCLSYIDVKNCKIWQVSYFSSDHNKSTDLISYTTSKIIDNGHIIKYDSIYYLNEFLETELSNHNIYY